MTILVGLLCDDGAVIAADRAITFEASDGETIRESAQKIHVIESKVILASAGPMGLGQRFRGVVKEHWTQIRQECLGKPSAEEAIATSLCAYGHRNFSSTNADADRYQGLLAMADPLMLVEYCGGFQPTLKSDEIPYVALGYGQHLGDAYLAFVRRLLFPKRRPTIPEAILSAVWSIHAAIKVSPGWIALPIDVAVIRPDAAGNRVARLLERDEVDEHLQNVETDLEWDLQDSFRKAANPPDTPEAPTPSIPPPPAGATPSPPDVQEK